MRRRNKGFSLVELMIAVTVTGFVITVAAQLLMGAGRSFGRTTAQLGVDQSAGIAIQMMTRDLQEAKQVDIVSPTRIRIYFPVKDGNGTYNRAVLDSVNTIDYYRGQANGDEDEAGPAVLRATPDGTTRSICRDVIELGFESTNPSSVDVTLRTRTTGANRVVQCEMIHRAIFMRNF